jgi:4-amino-4-deoxy-L-arabinose transferase-like glycosyltransferase
MSGLQGFVPSSADVFASGESSQQRRIFYAVLVALALRLIVVSFTYHGFLAPGRDHWEFGYENGRVARSLAEGHGFANPYWMPTGPTALIPPVYPFVLSVLFRVLGVNTKASAIAMLSLGSLFSALTCIPVFFVAKKTVGDRAARWAIWIWAFAPYAVYFSTDSMWYHSFAALLLTSLIWITLHFETSNSPWEWAGFGALVGFGTITNGVMAGMFPILAAWACYQLHQQKKKWIGPLFAATLAIFLVVTPWLVRNYEVFHKPVFVRDGFWLEVYVGNVGNSLHWWNQGIHPAGSIDEQNEYLHKGELAYMDHKKQQSIAYIESHPGTFASRTVRRIVYMWTGFWSNNPEYIREEPLDRANMVLSIPLTFLALWGLRKAFRNRTKYAALFGVILALYPAAYYITHPDLAYRLPLEPLIVILTTYAILSTPNEQERELRFPQTAIESA